MQHANQYARQCSVQIAKAFATASKNERSCARPALQGLRSQREDLTGKAWLLRKARPRCARPARAAPGLRAGVPEWSRVTSATQSRASVERGAPRCFTSGLSPSTSSPRRISARASPLSLESHRVLVSEPRVAGATFAGELYRRRALQPLHADWARSEIATAQVARLVRGRGGCARTRTS
jgi:hypothetical protein